MVTILKYLQGFIVLFAPSPSTHEDAPHYKMLEVFFTLCYKYSDVITMKSTGVLKCMWFKQFLMANIKRAK